MKELRGISVSPGISIGKVFLYIDDNPYIPKYDIEQKDIEGELQRFLDAKDKATVELEDIKDKTSDEMGIDDINFLDSHILLLKDMEFENKIKRNLHESLKNVEWILYLTIQELVEKLNASKNEYLRERTADIHDVYKRVLNHLMYRERISLADLNEEVVLVCKDLMPSDAIAMNKRMILGIATDAGGKTSHTAIIARSFEIPAVLGLSEVSKYAKNGDDIIVDGNQGVIILQPSDEIKEKYLRFQKAWQQREVQLMGLNELSAETQDGKLIMLNANIEVPEEVDSVVAHGADGIGLYRSEFLFLSPGRLPTEDEQFVAYKRVLESMKGKNVTIRTLDIGGDKAVKELEDFKEKNPILGWRAIRFCLSNTEIFKNQMRALLRASIYGHLSIMFPMISGIEELNRALELFEEVKLELRKKDIPFTENIRIGIMIEVPSAALTSDILARKVQFFSIGTNDLIQYTIAVDRGNENIAYLYEPFHPGVLRLIQLIIDNAHAVGIPVSMCGEMAGDPVASLILLGLGLDEFSMSAFGIPEVKRIIRSTTMAESEELVGTIMSMRSFKDIDSYVKQLMEDKFEIRTY